MRLLDSVLIVSVGALLLANFAVAQNTAQPATPPEPKSVTVPITLDHNRVIIDVYIPLPDGTTKRVRGWVDTGATAVWLSPRVAKLMPLTEVCNGQICSASPAPSHSVKIMIGGMEIPLASPPDFKVPGLMPPNTDSVMVPGTSAEIRIPSSTLRNYDVLIDFPDREFSIGLPGTLKFKGVKSKMTVDPTTGFVQLPGKIENKNYNLGLDIGSSISFLSQELFDKLASEHPDWPHMMGAVGPANMGQAADDEANWKLTRVDRIQYGPLFLTNVPFAESPKSTAETTNANAGSAVAGVLGSEALANYRVGLDYAHSTAYFDIGSTFRFPDFDVVGLVLRAESDTRFTIIGVADCEGKPSVPGVQPGDHLVAIDDIPTPDSTMGQVWSALGGSVGQERKLTVERSGKQFTVVAKVCHFLAEPEENTPKKKPRGKN